MILDEVDHVYGGYPESAGKSGIVSEGKGPFLECSVISFNDSIMLRSVWGGGLMNNARLSTDILKFLPRIFTTIVASDPFDISILLS